MATFHGKRATATYGTLANLNITSWSIEATCDTADATVMDTTAVGATVHWKAMLPGFKSWTATIELADDSDGITNLLTEFGDTATLALETTEGIAYGGSCVLTGIVNRIGIDDVARLTLSFVSDANMTAA